MQHMMMNVRRHSSFTFYLVFTVAPLLFALAILIDYFKIYTVDALKEITLEQKVLVLSVILIIESILMLFSILKKNMHY